MKYVAESKNQRRMSSIRQYGISASEETARSESARKRTDRLRRITAMQKRHEKYVFEADWQRQARTTRLKPKATLMRGDIESYTKSFKIETVKHPVDKLTATRFSISNVLATEIGRLKGIKVQQNTQDHLQKATRRGQDNTQTTNFNCKTKNVTNPNDISEADAILQRIGMWILGGVWMDHRQHRPPLCKHG